MKNLMLRAALGAAGVLVCLSVVRAQVGAGIEAPDEEVARIEEDHADMAIAYDPEAPEPLMVVVSVEEEERIYRTNEVILVVRESARLELPSGTPFGEAGDAIWVLPQSGDPDLINLGLSGEGLPLELFPNPLELVLRGVEGPGHFFLWQASQPGDLNVRMNSRDGITEDDSTPIFVGGHEHVNWGFSASGVYRITFQARGRRAGDETDLVSAFSTFIFHVLPLPASPFQTWQDAQFGQEASEEVKAPGADPDQDGIVNAVEYAFGMDPKTPSRAGLPTISVSRESGQLYSILKYRRVAGASDVRYLIEATDDLRNPSWNEIYRGTNAEPSGNAERIQIRDAEPISGSGHRYYRFRIELF